jgi:hypothetical protein
LTVDIISFGFYSGKGFWTVNLGARSIISASIPKIIREIFLSFGRRIPERKY